MGLIDFLMHLQTLQGENIRLLNSVAILRISFKPYIPQIQITRSTCPLKWAQLLKLLHFQPSLNQAHCESLYARRMPIGKWYH